MTAALRNRINNLEEKQSGQVTLPPILIYSENDQTLDEAKEQYKNQHGFELPANAPVLKIVRAQQTKSNNGLGETNK